MTNRPDGALFEGFDITVCKSTNILRDIVTEDAACTETDRVHNDTARDTSQVAILVYSRRIDRGLPIHCGYLSRK